MQEPLSEDEARAFLGRNADYFLLQWSALPDNAQAAMRFNWAAFFLGGPWLGYRKMYKAVAILAGVMILWNLLQLLSPLLGKPWLSYLLLLAIGVICGQFGNRWYLGRAGRVVRKVNRSYQDGYERRWRLAKLGGTSVVSSLLYPLLFFLGLVLLAAVAIPTAGISDVDPANISEIQVAADGVIHLNGTPITKQRLRSELRKIKRTGGGVKYYRAGGSTPTKAAEVTSAGILFMLESEGVRYQFLTHLPEEDLAGRLEK